ncbi:uncharacterized protein LOC130979602 isoform X2 [Arachis stenosperma]|uniref:uncharacterized protein LOC130979602 isoform X2 n=1 Tax=Arachis stenosperma TaxID=217475 RepID=UPI0025AD0F05|nr:uncharacterized protein LOC130979602 isoform X2 [Arachis stenosperma]
MAASVSLLRKLRSLPLCAWFGSRRRSLRSDAALEAIAKASEDKVPNLVVYNYPTFSGAFSALFAHLFHIRHNLPALILPFSSVPFLSLRIIGFDHRKSVLRNIPSADDLAENIMIHVNHEKSSSSAVYEYFSRKSADMNSDGVVPNLVESKDRERVEMILSYIEDGDLRRYTLPNIKAFNIGLNEWREKLNCISNPNMYKQLLELSAEGLIAKGNAHVSSRQDAASKLLQKVFRVRLGRGFYGECLGVRADGNSNLSDEIGRLLSLKSAAAGLRPIGAVIFMQRNNLKMCLRSMDRVTDTSEVARAYGGGGSPSSSSFIIRMDEYNQWI